MANENSGLGVAIARIYHESKAQLQLDALVDNEMECGVMTLSELIDNCIDEWQDAWLAHVFDSLMNTVRQQRDE